ncbi:hypothetical protein V8C42DRAFT_335736 [Trichoderma barbatum]
MASRYVSVHRSRSLGGPGDARPTALQIVQDQSLDRLISKVILVTGCSSGKVSRLLEPCIKPVLPCTLQRGILVKLRLRLVISFAAPVCIYFN